MILKKLSLARVRVFEQADFDFQPGMNLLVGVNGAGKSTILDVLRKMFSYTLHQFTAARRQTIPFAVEDIMVGQAALTADLDFQIDQTEFNHLVHIPRQTYTSGDKPDSLNRLAQHVGRERRIQLRREAMEGYTAVEINDLSTATNENINLDRLQKAERQPLVVYFSTRRSLPDMSAPTQASSAGGQAAAFAEALSHRELRLREFADWWLVQDALGKEAPKGPYGRRLRVLNDAVTSFLDDCHNLRAVREPQTTLVLDKGKKTLDIRMLSDGERSMVALVLDLARRLTLANPDLEFPLKKGKGVVLIDELDLHLHPQWQRTIVDKLTDTFPNCQFICTTHSPLIIGETQPSNLYLLTQINNQTQVKRKAYSYGLDANWILEHLMKTPVRPETVQTQITRVEDALENGELNKAREELATLREMMHSDVNEVVRLEASINTLEALADEVDTEE